MKLLSILSLSLATSTSAVSLFEDLMIQEQADGNSVLRKKNRRRGLFKRSQNHRNLEVSEECLNADAALEQAVFGNEENLATFNDLGSHINCPIDCGEDATPRLCTVGLGLSPGFMTDMQAWTDLCASLDGRLFYIDLHAPEILLRNGADCWPNVCSDDEVWELYSESTIDYTPADMTFFSKPPKGCSWVWSGDGGNMSEKRSKASKAAKAAKAMEGIH